MSDSAQHSRNGSAASQDTTASASAFPLILEHILQYPGSYEIPLRTMYTLNSASRVQQMPKRSTASSVESDASAASSNSPISDTSHFTSALMSHISKLPTQPCSLPPTFITSFVRRCFHPELTMVDFPQGLAALDYLKDLETRRRKEARGTFERLGIQADTIGTPKDDVSAKYPGVAQWVMNMEKKEAKIDEIYTQVYIGLRRWILINEMCLEPFNKHNCVAMLNTLYPPMVSQEPTKRLTKEMLLRQRDGFFNYIRNVESTGKRCLTALQDQGKDKSKGETNGWASTVRALDKYLTLANAMIKDCVDIQALDHFEQDEASDRGGRKTDSGISFGSERSKSSAGQSSINTFDSNRPQRPDYNVRGLSTIEKITREFRRMRSKSRSRIDIEEIRPRVGTPDSFASARTDEAALAASKDPGSRLKKMKSASALSTLHRRNGSATSLHGERQASDIPEFDPVAMQRHRELYEETRSKHSHKNSA